MILACILRGGCKCIVGNIKIGKKVVINIVFEGKNGILGGIGIA